MLGKWYKYHGILILQHEEPEKTEQDSIICFGVRTAQFCSESCHLEFGAVTSPSQLFSHSQETEAQSWVQETHECPWSRH